MFKMMQGKAPQAKGWGQNITLCAKISREERFIHIYYGIVTQMRKIGRSGKANPKEQKT
jgi:hypothetical protein